MKPRLPQTLFGRLFGLLLVLVLMGQAATWLILEWHRVHVSSRQVTEQALDVLAEAEERLYRTEDDLLPNNFVPRNQPYQIHLAPANTPLPRAHPPGFFAKTVMNELRQVLGLNASAIYSRFPKEQIWFEVNVAGADYWLVVPLARFHGPPLTPLLIGSAVFIALFAAGSAWFAWRLNRPLRKLAEVSEALARGKRIEDVSEEGPTEIRKLARSFNRMQTDLRKHERERELWLAGVSHDLRTPVTRLELALALLPDDQDHQAMLADLDEMKRTLQQFVDYARGSRQEPMTRVGVEGWLERLIRPFLAQGLDLHIHSSAPAEIMFKPISSGRILSNLLENARRYAAPPIELSLTVDDQRLILIVRDHGPGIPPEDLEELKHPFRRGGAARTADGGVGLGFAIVHRLVDELGGRWSAVNHAQGGLEVKVELPLP